MEVALLHMDPLVERVMTIKISPLIMVYIVADALVSSTVCALNECNCMELSLSHVDSTVGWGEAE